MTFADWVYPKMAERGFTYVADGGEQSDGGDYVLHYVKDGVDAFVTASRREIILNANRLAPLAAARVANATRCWEYYKDLKASA